jgi:hypothetical protein
MRLAAACFLGFTILLAIAMVAALLWNPSRDQPLFLLQLFIFAGGLTIWSAAATWQLWTNRGSAIGYTFVALLTMVILWGWSHYGRLQFDEPVHPVLYWLRNTVGLCVPMLWATLARATIIKGAKKDPDGDQP